MTTFPFIFFLAQTSVALLQALLELRFRRADGASNLGDLSSTNEHDNCDYENDQQFSTCHLAKLLVIDLATLWASTALETLAANSDGSSAIWMAEDDF